MITIEIAWPSGALDSASSQYRNWTEHPRGPRLPSPGEEAADEFIIASVNILANDTHLLDGPRTVVILRFLWQLKTAVTVVDESRPVAFECAPHFEDRVRVATRGDLVQVTCRSGLRGALSAPREQWRSAVDDAIDAVRVELRVNLPELVGDEFLGGWLRGGPVPGGFGVGAWVAEIDNA